MRNLWVTINGREYRIGEDGEPLVCANPTCTHLVEKPKRIYCSVTCRREHYKLNEKSSKTTPNSKAKPRICLSCDKTFLSEGPWNRICPRCSERNASLPPRAKPTHLKGLELEDDF